MSVTLPDCEHEARWWRHQDGSVRCEECEPPDPAFVNTVVKEWLEPGAVLEVASETYSPNGSTVLDEVRRFVRRFVVLDEPQAQAVSLWVAHTYVVDAFSCTPYLAITSAEKRSGKTRLLEVLALLVRDPLPTANISDAALFRVIDDKQPTLLIDEVDAIFGKKSPRDELRGIINAGYRSGSTTHRMGGKNNTELQTFSVFCPKAFAGIGDCLPDTIADRSIPIRLRRRTR